MFLALTSSSKTPPNLPLSREEKNKEKIIDNIIHYETVTTSCKSSGPGGQNVNKRETQAILRFNVKNSQSLTNKQKEKLKKIAGKKINNEWILRITDQVGRTKEWNTENALNKFKNLLTLALEEDKIRIPTKVPKSVNEKRLNIKKKQSQLKTNRGRNTIGNYE